MTELSLQEKIGNLRRLLNSTSNTMDDSNSFETTDAEEPNGQPMEVYENHNAFLTEQLASMQKELNEAQIRIQVLEHEQGTEKETIKSLKNELKSVEKKKKQENEDNLLEVEELNQMLNESQRQLAGVQKKVLDLNHENQRLSVENNKKDADLTHLQKEISRNKMKISEFKLDIQRLQDQFNLEQNEKQNIMIEFDEYKKETSLVIDNLKSEKEILRHDYETTITQIKRNASQKSQEFDQKYHSLSNQVDEMTALVVNLQNQIQEMTKRKVSLEKQNKQLSQEVAIHERKMKSMSDMLEQQKKQTTLCQNVILSKKTENDSLQKQIEQLEKQNNRSHDELHSQIKSLRQELNKKALELKESENNREYATKDFIQIQAKYEHEVEMKNQYLKEKENMQDEMDRRISELQRQLKDREEAYQASLSKVQVLDNNYRNMQQESQQHQQGYIDHIQQLQQEIIELESTNKEVMMQRSDLAEKSRMSEEARKRVSEENKMLETKLEQFENQSKKLHVLLQDKERQIESKFRIQVDTIEKQLRTAEKEVIAVKNNRDDLVRQYDELQRKYDLLYHENKDMRVQLNSARLKQKIQTQNLESKMATIENDLNRSLTLTREKNLKAFSPKGNSSKWVNSSTLKSPPKPNTTSTASTSPYMTRRMRRRHQAREGR